MADAKTIDFHAHFLDAEVLKASAGKTVSSGFGAKASTATSDLGSPLVKKMIDPAIQVADMDQNGIDVAVISSASVIEGTSWADAETDLTLCRKINDRAAEWCARYPGRFVGSFVLPLQDIDRSMKEMERATGELGLAVGNFSSNYKGDYLGDARYTPVWQYAESHGLPIFIHPEGVTDMWFQRFFLWNSLGQSIEETKVMASLIYEGIWEKFPDLKIVMAHGGGYFPHYCGRVDRNTRVPEAMANIKNKPSSYLGRFYYDSCTYDAHVLAALAGIVGADRIVMGSDYPVGDPDPRASVVAAGLPAAEQRGVLGDNAARLLGL